MTCCISWISSLPTNITFTLEQSLSNKFPLLYHIKYLTKKKLKNRSTGFSLSEKQKSIIWLSSIIKLGWHDTPLYCILSNFLLSSKSIIILSFKYCSTPCLDLKSDYQASVHSDHFYPFLKSVAVFAIVQLTW